ncbi:sensor histidine kinase [Halobiforma nitratireducens]|uniref:histidine kinase n=1 Tax=Halobiforma nitratireducens JCM 10879 TaxID=1227454 RepID=M0LDQ6_9EURY|nr:HAMP domain-containing sensor histidine kinase [Halobiforma nitratireducens]EMA31248.1 GAF sensor signal transduction histidine kinase [Halobiforma nitratireducens JCM 10879]
MTETGRRSFHVRYAGADDAVRERVRETLEPTYRVTTVSEADSPRELLDADADVDCLVLASDATDGTTTLTDSLEALGATRPDLPIVPFVSVADIDGTCREWAEALLEAAVSDVVYRDVDADDAGDAEPGHDYEHDHHDPVRRLRNRIDDRYEQSVADAGETVLEIARSLMGAAPDEVDIEIEWGLESVGKRLDADRALVFDYERETDRFVPTHTWFARPESIGENEPEPLPTASFPGYRDAIRAFDVHAIPAETGPDSSPEATLESSLAADAEVGSDDDFEIPEGFIGDIETMSGGEGAADADSALDSTSRVYLEERDLEALLAIPIVVDWELTGVLVVAGRHRRPWPTTVRRQLRTLGELIGHRLERRRRRRELVRQNDRLEQFASVVSHDLRNPLNVISGSAQLVAETGDDDYLEDVIEATERMEDMIEDLLTLARDGDSVGQTQSVALEAVVQAAWNDVATEDATLEFDAGELPTIDADRGRLRQALENLIRNAIEHNDGEVCIRVEATDDGFAVADDGVGIPPDRRDRIFEEGYTEGGGTGLGLSIVETIVSAHGWSVAARESEHGGARFEIATEPSSSASPSDNPQTRVDTDERH